MEQSTKLHSDRVSWDDYFLALLEPLALRSTCDRGKCSAIITKNNRILTTGYAGAPSGLPHCDEAGHLMKTVHTYNSGVSSEHCTRTVHAEANAILQAARNGVAIEGGCLYVKMTPCDNCVMLIINSGIKRVICKKRYQRSEALDWLLAAGIDLIILSDEVEKY